METKYFIKSTGDEVKIGDTLSFSKKEKIEGGTISSFITITLNEKNAVNLSKQGFIKIKNKHFTMKGKDFKYYMDKCSNKIYHAGFFSAMLKDIAVDLDKQYEDHISACPTIFVINVINGKIRKINAENISNYKNFAAFRTEEDAKTALTILKSLYTEMYGEQKD